MHTVFINTSKNPIGDRADVLDMEKEFKKITLLQCPLSSWLAGEGGFEECALQIGDIIDTHKEINNEFNVIVYADLLEIPEYQAVFASSESSKQQKAAANEILCGMMARLAASTLLSKLDELGRRPAQKILLLLEQNKCELNGSEAGVANAENENFYSEYEKTKVKLMLEWLGLPGIEELTKMEETASKADDLESQLNAERANKQAGLSVLNPCRLYEERIRLFYDSFLDYVKSGKEKNAAERVCMDFLKGVEDLRKGDLARSVVISDFYTDRRDSDTNMEMGMKRNLQVQFFLLNCVHSESVYKKNDDPMTAKAVPEMSAEKWERLIDALAKKRDIYAGEEKEIQGLHQSYTDINLAPPLYKFAYQKFGLDESGGLRRKLVVKKKLAKEEKKKKSDKKEDLQKTKTNAAKTLSKKPEFELVDEDGRVRNWFGDQFSAFDAKDRVDTDHSEKLMTPDEYVERATSLANHHNDFLSALSRHVSNVMSNYAGRSLTNKPAVLRKRTVSVGGDGADGSYKDYKYSQDTTVDTTPLESIMDTSKRSYLTLLMEYLRFNADRDVAVTTFKEQCEWFINRIRQIEESLKKLLRMLVVVGAILIVLYTPFLLIQWESITKGLDSVLIAAAFLAASFVLLLIGYNIAVLWQKRKMRKAWKKLVKKSDDVLAENAAAADAYDTLLTVYIPSLRWVYEYVLDVDFYRDCCRIADAKLAHHRSKLHERCVVIGNILEDLKSNKPYLHPAKDYNIYYSKAFCEGENKDYYSIIDRALLEIING